MGARRGRRRSRRRWRGPQWASTPSDGGQPAGGPGPRHKPLVGMLGPGIIGGGGRANRAGQAGANCTDLPSVLLGLENPIPYTLGVMNRLRGIGQGSKVLGHRP